MHEAGHKMKLLHLMWQIDVAQLSQNDEVCWVIKAYFKLYWRSIGNSFCIFFWRKKTFLVVSNTCQWCEILREKKTVQNSWMNFPISYLFDVFCGILNQRKEQELVWKYVKAWNDTLRYMYDTISDREKLHQRICMEPRGFTSFDVN